MCVCIYRNTHICVYIRIHSYVCIYIYIHTHAYMYTYIYIYTCDIISLHGVATATFHVANLRTCEYRRCYNLVIIVCCACVVFSILTFIPQ